MNERSFRTLQIVILAAGFSSRLGQPKALARVRGLTLLARTLKTARGLAGSSTLVVIPPNAARYKFAAGAMQAAWVINRGRSDGLSSSVRRGILAARYASAILFLPVDLVSLKRREVAGLIRRWRASPRRLVARRLGDSGAIPLILPKRLFPRALDLTGDIGLRQLIAAIPREQCVFVKLASAAADVDTPQALSEARRRSRPPG
jgi:molybdenum cofactor cytidylyltransferase